MRSLMTNFLLRLPHVLLFHVTGSGRPTFACSCLKSSMGKWKLVGIAGVTCGGKTTLAEMLKKTIKNCIVIKQDEYFYDENSDHHVIIPELQHANWECLSSINWKELEARVKELLNEEPKDDYSTIIIDGHLIFNYEPLEKLFHKKFFLTLSKEECWERRRVRVYNPPDPPGYFDICVWPMYLKNKQEMAEKVNDIVYLNGSEDKNELFKKVIKEFNSIISF
ncbi:nicotinamide riboside kinase 1 [Centruroides vittatus]|uniref:nicotinamide riboside kinase 1 n=1 Tax=Centruroides vittatus TaxID=120091 RepID=UPI00350EAF32